jgi:glycosyltransferase involved in cell wall biosynthesis
MKINIVTVNSGWILQKIAERLYSTNKDLFSLSYYEPNNFADANIYIDIQNCFYKKSKTIDIGYFTHLHEDNIKHLEQNLNWLQCDHIIHMCQKYATKFEKYYPIDKMTVLPIAEKLNYKIKKTKIGIFQRGQYEGKGFYFMNELCGKNIFTNFEIYFVGKGWKQTCQICEKNNISFKYFEEENYSEYEKIYEQIDYLFIPSLWEGGPMSVIEAYSKGIPIISSNVGWVSDFNIDYLYEPNNINQAIEIFNRIDNEKTKRIEKVSYLSYQKSADKILKIINKIKNNET